MNNLNDLIFIRNDKRLRAHLNACASKPGATYWLHVFAGGLWSITHSAVDFKAWLTIKIETFDPRALVAQVEQRKRSA